MKNPRTCANNVSNSKYNNISLLLLVASNELVTKSTAKHCRNEPEDQKHNDNVVNQKPHAIEFMTCVLWCQTVTKLQT